MNEIKLKVVMSKKFDEITKWFTNNYKNEVAGFITGGIKDGVIMIDDLLIPEQEVGGATVDMSGKSQIALRKEYGKKCEKIIGEWHSHCKMGVHWSCTDEDEMITPYADVRDFSVFVVSNEKEHRVRVEIRKPLWISVDEVEYVVNVSDKKIEEFCQEVIEKKLTEKTYKPSKVEGRDRQWGDIWGGNQIQYDLGGDGIRGIEIQIR